MRTNALEKAPQNLTFIGCSNSLSVAELIRDTTGTRRFAGLHTKHDMDWQVVNSIDWQAVWQSVDEKAEDPITPFKAKLDAVQAEDRLETPFEAWVQQLEADSQITVSHANQTATVTMRRHERFTTSELYDTYKLYEEDQFLAEHRRNPWSIKQFNVSLKAYAKTTSAKFHLEMTRGGAKASYFSQG